MLRFGYTAYRPRLLPAAAAPHFLAPSYAVSLFVQGEVRFPGVFGKGTLFSGTKRISVFSRNSLRPEKIQTVATLLHIVTLSL